MKRSERSGKRTFPAFISIWAWSVSFLELSCLRRAAFSLEVSLPASIMVWASAVSHSTLDGTSCTDWYSASSDGVSASIATSFASILSIEPPMDLSLRRKIGIGIKVATRWAARA